MLSLRTVVGLSQAKIRDCTRGRRSQVGMRPHLAEIDGGGKEHKVCLRVVRETEGCCGKPRGLRLGKPSLMMIRDERLLVVRGNGCCDGGMRGEQDAVKQTVESGIPGGEFRQ